MPRLYVSSDAKEWQQLNVGVDEDPFHELDRNGNKVFSLDGGWTTKRLRILHAKWQSYGATGRYSSEHPFIIYPSPDFAQLVVVFSGENPLGFPLELSPPNNALVLNADGSVRHRIKQPARYAGKPSEFYDAWWYERETPPPERAWWLFWRASALPRVETRMKMLILPYRGNPTGDFEALDFDPATGEFGELVERGRL